MEDRAERVEDLLAAILYKLTHPKASFEEALERGRKLYELHKPARGRNVLLKLIRKYEVTEEEARELLENLKASRVISPAEAHLLRLALEEDISLPEDISGALMRFRRALARGHRRRLRGEEGGEVSEG